MRWVRALRTRRQGGPGAHPVSDQPDPADDAEHEQLLTDLTASALAARPVAARLCLSLVWTTLAPEVSAWWRQWPLPDDVDLECAVEQLHEVPDEALRAAVSSVRRIEDHAATCRRRIAWAQAAESSVRELRDRTPPPNLHPMTCPAVAAALDRVHLTAQRMEASGFSQALLSNASDLADLAGAVHGLRWWPGRRVALHPAAGGVFRVRELAHLIDAIPASAYPAHSTGDGYDALSDLIRWSEEPPRLPFTPGEWLAGALTLRPTSRGGLAVAPTTPSAGSRVPG